MNRTVARCLYGILFAGGITLLGATAANAADTSGDDGVLSGTLVDSVVSIPVTVGGNAVSVLGDSGSDSAATNTAPAAASAPSTAASSTSGDDGIASGSQVTGAVSVPVTIGGNAVAVLGDSSSTDASTPVASGPVASQGTTSGDDSIAGGSQVSPVVTVPVAIGGNSISVLGDSSSDGSTGSTFPAGSAAGTGSTTSGDDGIASGSQVLPAVTAPVTAGGNAISVIGDSSSSGSTTGSTTDAATPAGSSSTSGDDGIAGGTQVAPVVTAPISAGGNAVSVIGDSSSAGSTTGASNAPSGSTGSTTSGDDGVAGGTQVAPAITAPVGVGGNAVSVIGDSSSSGYTTGGSTAPSGSTGSTTSGDDGVAGGTQVAPVISVPLDLGGNSVSVIGDSSTGTDTDSAPVAPTVPGIPTTPTAPVDPSEPGAPSTPGDASSEGVSDSGIEAGVETGMTAQVTASADPQLAETGTDGAALLLRLAALMLLGGAAIVLFGRKRQAQRI